MKLLILTITLLLSCTHVSAQERFKYIGLDRDNQPLYLDNGSIRIYHIKNKLLVQFSYLDNTNYYYASITDMSCNVLPFWAIFSLKDDGSYNKILDIKLPQSEGERQLVETICTQAYN